MKRIAINGFGRIGRLSFRNLIESKEVEIVAINDLSDTETLAHLLKFDSVHGPFTGTVSLEENKLKVNESNIHLFSERNPENLPWRDLNIDLVLECTGIFRDLDGLQKHISAGAKKVLLSAPAKAGVKTIVLGVNDHEITADDVILSNASCTTNCLAPMAKVLDEKFGIVKGYMTTVHAYTADQRLQDSPHSDLRRARAAAVNIIPTTTGAAEAVAKVLPQLEGKLSGMAMRVPTPSGSVTDLTIELTREVSEDQINQAMKEASLTDLKGVLQYSEDPLVSSDIIGNKFSCIFDSKLTSTNGSLVKIIGWYDNEAGYSARLSDMALKFLGL